MTAIETMVRQMCAIKWPTADLHGHIVALSKTMSQRQIAREVGVSRTTVFNVLRAGRSRGQS